MTQTTATWVSIGLRAKTGRAIAVAVRGPSTDPKFVRRAQLKLVDPAVKSTSQPYHEVMDLPWARAQVAVREINKRIETIAYQALSRLVGELAAEGFEVRGVAIVGAGDRNLERIGSPHIRAHAAEGVLFRHVLEVAASRIGLRCRALDERRFDEIASAELKRSPALIKDKLTEMGRVAGSPWRAEEKAAAVAAWLALAGRAKK